MENIQFVQISKEEFSKDVVKRLEDKFFSKIKDYLKPKEQTVYLTRKEVAKMLKIDISSVHNWSKRGILKPYQIGYRVYYKLAEVENSIVELKK
jgi:hypothetical protein